MRAWRRSEVKVSSCTFTDNLSQIRFNLCISVWTLHILWKEEIKSKVHKNYFAVLVLLSCSVKRCIVQSCIQILTEFKVCKNNLLNVLQVWKCSLSVFFLSCLVFFQPSHVIVPFLEHRGAFGLFCCVSQCLKQSGLSPPACWGTNMPSNKSVSDAPITQFINCRILREHQLQRWHTPHLLTHTSPAHTHTSG